ncbi:hypothetical protein [Flexithrix dorotheae]|uniref:hypothetical protein n=1 Tax=Flexithrix dorotheae TaxID=70993 RepID=UPI0012F8BF61|nr:hypothetical protein [Flexithrix dorotheae]
MKHAALILSMLIGVVLPFGDQLTFMVRYLVMGMLFFAYLDIKISRNIITKSHFLILLANILIAFVFYFIFLPFNPELAVIAFITGIMPTAAAAPAIISYLEGKVAFVTFSVVLTNSVIALIIPFVLPSMVSGDISLNVLDILAPVLSVVFIPLLLSWMVKRFLPVVQPHLLKIKGLSFIMFNLNIYIATSTATRFIMEGSSAITILNWIAIMALFICVTSFAIGKWIGKNTNPEESRQALGRKNTMFSIWIALTYLSPLAALGPMFYILWHNLYNSYQIYRLGQKKKLKV